MNINIEDYLSESEIKDIVKQEVKEHVRICIGAQPQNFIALLAKRLAKEGVQEIIPDFKELINNQIKEQISKVTLSDFFVSSFGWSNPGNKVLNSVLSDNKALLDAKIKEIFKTVDK